MAYNFEEQEQLDDLKAWWNKYGGFILTVVVVVSVSVAGWRLWGWYQAKQAGKAAVALSVLRDAVRNEDLSKVRVAASTLMDNHAGSAYAPMAGLLAAKAHVQAEDLPAAEKSLQWIVDNAADTEFAPLAHLRLASVRLDQGMAQEALAALEAATVPESFQGALDDRRGDILTALGRNDDAKKAYQASLDTLPERSPLRSLVQFKLEALGGGE